MIVNQLIVKYYIITTTLYKRYYFPELCMLSREILFFLYGMEKISRVWPFLEKYPFSSFSVWYGKKFSSLAVSRETPFLEFFLCMVRALGPSYTKNDKPKKWIKKKWMVFFCRFSTFYTTKNDKKKPFILFSFFFHIKICQNYTWKYKRRKWKNDLQLSDQLVILTLCCECYTSCIDVFCWEQL